MDVSLNQEQLNLFQQLEGACWNANMHTLGFDRQDLIILPTKIKIICDEIKNNRLPLPINQLLDMSDFEKNPDYYRQRYVIGYFELINAAINYIEEYYQQLGIEMPISN